MKILWKYLKPFRGWLWLAMGLAAVAQVLQLVDPIIFGKIIDQFALNPGGRGEAELIRGALHWLAIAVAIGLAGRVAHALTDYVTRLVVQKFGLAVFDEGLRQTLRLPYHEFEEVSSGHVLSMLVKVRHDNEKFISAFIGVLFSSLVGVAFLVWYAIDQALGADPGLPRRRRGPGRHDRAAQPPHQDHPARRGHARPTR